MVGLCCSVDGTDGTGIHQQPPCGNLAHLPISSHSVESEERRRCIVCVYIPYTPVHPSVRLFSGQHGRAGEGSDIIHGMAEGKVDRS